LVVVEDRQGEFSLLPDIHQGQMQVKEKRMKCYRQWLAGGIGCLALTGLAILGCARPSAEQESLSFRGLVKSQLSPPQLLQAERAAEAKGKLAEDLLRELMQAMTQPPITQAIKVCKEQAPQIAAKVGEEKDLLIGRTSFKLRNLANQAPGWAEAFVKQQVQEEVYISLPENQLGVLYPIKMQNTCLMCHGSQLPSDLQAAIVSYYPRDQATGFSEGDLRGYFWVEVPAPAETPLSPEASRHSPKTADGPSL
jgi:hypothetical protein